jgi:hypothetical protein
VTCTECKAPGPEPDLPRRRGRMSWHQRETYAEAARARLAELGWFVYERNCPVRFAGVVLCPTCRQKPTGKDAYGNVYPTAELEELAGGKGPS